MLQQPLVVIGCGDFGAAAVDHLKKRPLTGTVNALAVTDIGSIITRADAEKRFRAFTETGWPALAEAVQGATPLFGIVASAEDAASGGILIALLPWLKERYRSARIMLAVALPESKSGGLSTARTYATLLEMQALYAKQAFDRCALRAVDLPSTDEAPMFADALLMQRGLWASLKPGYVSFGLGIAWDNSKATLQRLSEALAREAVERELGPTTPGAAAELEARLRSSLKPVLEPVTESKFFRDSLYLAQTPEAEEDIFGLTDISARLRTYSAMQASYYANLRGTQRIAREYERLQQQVMQALRRLLQDLPSAERSSMAEVLVQLIRALTEAVQASKGLRMDEGRYERAFRGLLENPARLRETNRKELWQFLKEHDRLLLQSELEPLRAGVLTAILNDLQAEYQTKFAKFRRTEQMNRLLERARAVFKGELNTAKPPPHMIAPVVDAQILRSGQLDLSPLLDQIWQTVQLGPEYVMRIKQSAQAVLEKSRLFQAPEYWRAGSEAWRPNLGIRSGSPEAERRLFTLWHRSPLPPGLEGYLKPLGDQVERVRLTFSWLDEEHPLYAETAPFTPEQLACWASYGESYAAQPNREWLHTLADLAASSPPAPAATAEPPPPAAAKPPPPAPAEPPPAQVPYQASAAAAQSPPASARAVQRRPSPPEELSPAQVQAAAATLLRAALLGLFTPAPDQRAPSRYTLQTLRPDGTVLVAHNLPSLSAAIRLLATQEGLREQVDRLTLQWRNRLPPRGLAAYGALILWTTLNKRLEELLPALQQEYQSVDQQLNEHGPLWRQLAQAMLLVVGTERDDFSLPAGEWRYIQW